MKVLHVIGRRPKGGIGSFLLNMLKSRSDLHIKHEFLIHADEKVGDFDEKVKNYNCSIHVLPSLKFNNVPYIFYEYIKFYSNFDNGGVVHVHSPVIFIVNYLFAKLLSKNLKVGCHSHSTKYSDGGLKSIRNFFLYKIVRFLSDFNLSCSKYAGEFLFGDDRFTVLNNGIFTDDYIYSEEVRRKKLSELEIKDKIIIGHVGNFLPVKNHKFMVDLIKHMNEVYPGKYHLVLVGAGELFSDIQAYSTELKLSSSISYLGSRGDVNELLCAFDLLLLPSFYEGFPLVSIEAQASGLNAICSDGVPEDINLLGGVSFLSLNENRNMIQWESKIIQYTGKSINGRSLCSSKIKELGFDVVDTTQQLECIYRDINV